MKHKDRMSAIIPCSDIVASEKFYRMLGFRRNNSDANDYMILTNPTGAELHLRQANEGWLVRGKNPFGLYLYTERVDDLANLLESLIVSGPENKPWGMYEFAFSDPDGTLVRVGWPTANLRRD